MVNGSAIGSAFGAMESLLGCLTSDLSPQGIRVVGLRSGGMLQTRTLRQSVENVARQLRIPKEQVVSVIEQAYLLKRHATVADTARLLAFLASDGAATITGSHHHHAALRWSVRAHLRLC